MLIGDSAYPPSSYPTAYAGQPIVGWCVYIGGNTPHVWTAAEIAHLRAQPWCRYILPTFTRSNPAGANAAADAAAAVTWARAHGQPSGTLVMWDYETAVDSAYELAVDKALQASGLHEILYGSKATVTKNSRPSGGYDAAAWTGHDYAPADVADQFANTAAYDLNDFRATAPLWDLHPATAAPAAESEDEMSTTSSAGRAGISWPAGSRHVVQVTYDPAQGNPKLRVVLALTTGPWVAPQPWVLAKGNGTFEIPQQYRANCRGVILEGAATGEPVYDACAV